MRTLIVDRWIIEVDTEATAAAYLSMLCGSALGCGCTDCKNWLEQRDGALPLQLFDLLAEIGIDAKKETELSEYEGGQVRPEQNLYWGEYLFVGRVLEGPECYVTQPDGKGCSIELQPTFSHVKFGISSNVQWAHQLPEFPEGATSVLVFQVRAKRGIAYA